MIAQQQAYPAAANRAVPTHRHGLLRSRRVRGGLVAALQYLLLLVCSVLFLAPLAWAVSTSLKPADEVFLNNLIPTRWMWENYWRAMTERYFPLYKAFWNSVVIVTGTLVGSLVSNTIVAYGFARLRFPGRNILFLLVLATMMLPGQVTMVPTYVLFSKLGWTNSFKPLIVPAFFGAPFFIFLLRQYYMTLPRELDDAARIDGCGPLGIYWRVILPLAGPAVTTVAVFTFIWTWGEYFGPLLYINRPEKMPLPLALSQFRPTGMGQQMPWHLLMAASIVTLIPQLIVYFVAQRSFIEGISLTGVKG